MSHSHHDPLYEEIMEICGQDPALCYQCGKCSGNGRVPHWSRFWPCVSCFGVDTAFLRNP